MIFEFENFVVNTELAELAQDGHPVAIEPRVFDLLVYLIQNRDRVPSKDDIVEAVWSGRFISDSAISSSVKSLRQALGDDGEAQRVIRTVRGRGFRFVADLVEAPAPARASVAATAPAPATDATAAQPPTGGKPSIVVLPFQTAYQDDTNRILSEAIPHELIQALSRLRWLRVIARGSAFRFTQADPDLERISELLSVRYALQGSVNRIGEVLIVTVELSNCITQNVVWAERFETRADTLHEMRAKVVGEVVAALEIFIPADEAQQAHSKAPASLDAWANYHLGLRHMFRFSKDANRQAVGLFSRALELEPDFARAHAGLSFARFQDAFVRYVPDRETAIQDAIRHAERSVELDPLDPFSNFNMGRSFWLRGDTDGGDTWLERAVSLSPNFAQGHYSRGFAQVMSGQSAAALGSADLAQNLSPIDPLLYAIHAVRAMSHYREGRLEAAIEQAELAARSPGAHYLIPMVAAMIHAGAGNMDRMKYWRDLAKAKRPDASSELLFVAFPLRGEDFVKRVEANLKTAGF